MKMFSVILFLLSFFLFYLPQIEKPVEKENFLLNLIKEKNPEEMKKTKMPEKQIPGGINQN